MGNITGAMVFQSAIPTVVALLFAPDAWVAAPRAADRVRVGGHRVPRRRPRSSSRWPPGGCAAAGCWSAACSTWPTSRSWSHRDLAASLGPSGPHPAAARAGAGDSGRGVDGRGTEEPPHDADREAHRGRRARPPCRRRPMAPGSIDDLVAYFEGDFVPMRDAKVSVMTHAFMYGTATFEGIRAYWNAGAGQLYGLKLREHVERIRAVRRDPAHGRRPVGRRARPARSSRRSAGTASARTPTSGRRSTSRPRRSASGSTTSTTSSYIVALPFGNYIDTDNGVRVMTSSWRRNADEALPARGKIVGGYVNMAFQKSEAELNGFDEALVLTADGHVNEASAANLFVVRDGVALTPPVTDDILEGVTRKAIIELLGNEGIPVEVRSIDRSELYVADEIFLCGTGVQVSPVVELDHRPVGSARSARSHARARPLLRRGPRAAAEYQPLADARRLRFAPRSAARACRQDDGGGVRFGRVASPSVMTTSAADVRVVRRLDGHVERFSRYAIVAGAALGAVVDDDLVLAGLALGLLARRRGGQALVLEVAGDCASVGSESPVPLRTHRWRPRGERLAALLELGSTLNALATALADAVDVRDDRCSRAASRDDVSRVERRREHVRPDVPRVDCRPRGRAAWPAGRAGCRSGPPS